MKSALLPPRDTPKREIVGRRLKVKVELFPARANLESFGLCTEGEGQREKEGGGKIEKGKERERERVKREEEERRGWSGKKSDEMADTTALYYSAQF